MRRSIALIALVAVTAFFTDVRQVEAALPGNTDFPQSGSIVSRWKLDEASGTRADSVGSNDLTDNNTVLSASCQFNTDCADFELDNSEFLSITDASQSGLDLQDWTVSAWVNPETLGITQSIAVKALFPATSNNRQWYNQILSNNKGRIRYSNDGIDGTIIETDSALLDTTGEWVHIVFTVDVSALDGDMYKNGESQAVTTVDNRATTVINADSGVTIGAGEQGNQEFDGLMQDVIIWNVKLTDEEVLELYNSYSEPEAAPIFFQTFHSDPNTYA